MSTPSSPETALEAAEKAARVAAGVITQRNMISALLPFFSDSEAYTKARFPSLIDWTVRFTDAHAVRNACQISQARLDRWLKGVTPEPRERESFIDIIRLMLEERLPA